MEIFKVFSSKNIWSMSIIFVLVLSALLLSSHQAQAANASEYVWFVIDTELDVRNDVDDSHVVTVRWSCASGLTGLITDKTASEYGGAVRDGIIKVASASKEMTDAGCSFTSGATIRASASLDGWVTRTKEFTMLASTNYSTYFGAGASMDYNFVAVGPIKDELGTTHVLDSSTASVSFSGSTASISYSNYDGTWKRYFAVTGTGILTGGISSNYVDKTVSTSWSGNFSTVSQSADFNAAITSTYNGSQLPYGVKVTYNTTNWRGETTNYTTGATVLAGDSLAVSCTGSSDSVNDANYNYYCLVPATETGTTAQATLATYTTSNTCTYTAPRTTNATAQSSCTIAAVQATSVTQGGGGIVQLPAETTPTPTLTPIPTPTTAVITQLFRKANDPKVYVQGSDGTLTWVKTIEAFNVAGYSWANVKVISGEEFGKMRVGGSVRVVNGVAFLRVRAGPSTAGKIVGKVLSNQELGFTEMKNGWYHINSGWVSGAYAKEF